MILFKVLTKKLVKDGASQCQNFYINFHIFCAHCPLWDHHSRLGYHKFCARWISEILTGVHKTQRMALALAFLEWYHKDSDKLLSHIIWVSNRWWNLDFICECWNQIAVKAVDAHTFTKQAKILNKLVPESWWKLFSRTGKECWWWNSCNVGSQ
jgi:hypothetical protein